MGGKVMNKRSRKKRMKRIAKAAGFAFAMTVFSAAVYVTQIKERSSMEKISSGTYTQADSRTHSWLTLLHNRN